MNRVRPELGICVALLIVFAPNTAVSSNPFQDPSIATYFPDDEWERTTPEEQGMSSEVLNNLIHYINESDSRVDGLVITRNGYIVEEEYWLWYNEDVRHHIFSCTKSFTSAILGIAIKEGFIDNVSQKMVDFFPEYEIENPSEYKSSITVEHLLTMTHGLDWNEHNISYTNPENMYMQMFYQSRDPVQFFLNLPSVYPPGEHWAYTTGASHMLSAIIQQATDMTTKEFAEEYLFGPLNEEIGMWTTFDGVYSGGTQLYVTPRAMTKLGLLYLNNGTWGTQELLTEDYVTASRTPYISIGEDMSYGYQWWIDNEEGGYMALGSQMQLIYIHPELNIVVSITGSVTENRVDISREIIQYVLSSVEGYVPSSGIDNTQLIAVLGISSVTLVTVVGAIYYIKKKGV